MFEAELAKTHALQMEEVKNRFTMGAMSPMAEIAFNKHATFCEKYVSQVLDTLANLFREDPTLTH